MNLILDASMALAWLFERPDPTEAQRADQALQALEDMAATVPSLWHTEVANALLVAERRGVVSEAQVMDYLNRLSHLPIATDDVPQEDRRESVMALARHHRLTAYDATYLDLALRSGAALATFDGQLAGAMRAAGGTIFGEGTGEG